MGNSIKYLVIVLAVIVLGAVAMIVYRMFFQFDQTDIHIYAKEAAEKYGQNSKVVYGLILEGVEEILSHHNQTQQVLRAASASGMDKEQVLVNTAVNLCHAQGYLREA